MQLTISQRHICFINRFATSYTLKRKFENALLADPSNTSPLTINTSKAEYMDVYQGISSQPEGYYAKINRQVEAEILPQLMAVMGNPEHADYAEVSELLAQLTEVQAARAQVVEELIAAEKLFFDKLNPNYAEPNANPEPNPPTN